MPTETTPPTAPTPEALLDDDLLARIRERADRYDRENAFFTEDLAELADRGYLRALVPTAMGGLGWSHADVIRAQSRLATAAPATALGVNMHLVWTGVARHLHDRGDDTLDFVLAEAAAGEVFAFGISEAGNDLMLFGSGTVADPQPDGGIRYTGRKIFTSLSPRGRAWAFMGWIPHRRTRRSSSTGSSTARIPTCTPSPTGTRSACARRRAARPCSTARSPRPTGSSGGSTRARTPTRSCPRSSRASSSS
ncbi:hypothetical protein GCM10025870_28560 [Agromyces marinus]|uniref:Acyl-CoA dehydrogenase/oxidase N-terminal domain-containing protein n=1 Tax=Agromyces marinus TaxID=1389020 RepID=A0ABM8H4R0_9MICO|nr:hypothetical protein GCM10025870_28560 [Agromyces marinus]